MGLSRGITAENERCTAVPLCVILSERSESKDLRTCHLLRRHLMRRSFDFGLRPSLRMTVLWCVAFFVTMTWYCSHRRAVGLRPPPIMNGGIRDDRKGRPYAPENRGDTPGGVSLQYISDLTKKEPVRSDRLQIVWQITRRSRQRSRSRWAG